MTESSKSDPLYHVLLIGISAYPPDYNSLSGCVNDIDAIENLLLDAAGVGLEANRVRIRRLAAPREGMVSTSRLVNETQFPNKQNVVMALEELGGEQVRDMDRVLIYYSGHGDFYQVPGAPTHEMLALNGGTDVEYLFDVELNRYLAAIAARTNDLTVVLDCCHSGGVTRGPAPRGAAKRLERKDGRKTLTGPDLPNLRDRSLPATMLAALDPTYLALAACQAEERAHEGYYDDKSAQGALTKSLVDLIQPLQGTERATVRWADIMPRLVDSVDAACFSVKQPAQHPSLIGRGERRVFGGPWHRQDPGFTIRQLPTGEYSIGAGSLMGVSRDAILAVYGPKPAEFPPLGKTEDLGARIGELKIVIADRATSIAHVIGTDFEPTGARARLITPGANQRLCVLLQDPNPELATVLSKSNLLRIVTAEEPGVEVRVGPQADGGWTITDENGIELARVPANEFFALRAGLESYHRFRTVLRLARNSNDPELQNVLSLTLLDCSDANALARLDPINPGLPEAPRADDGIYSVPARFAFCIQVSSQYHDSLRKSVLDQSLHVSLFDCSAGGSAQYLGNTTLVWHQDEKQGDRQLIWQQGDIGNPFQANPDPNFENGGTDRIVAVATTRQDVNLRGLEVVLTVQEVINDQLRHYRGALSKSVDSTPSELWTAVMVPIRIGFPN